MISLVRVDNRLIHGQVVEAWLPHLKVRRVVVADDDAAQSDLIRAAMSMAVPSSVDVQIQALAEVDFSALAGDAVPTLLLFRDVAGISQAAGRGLRPGRINLGNVHHRPERRRVSTSVFLSPQEVSALEELSADGAEVEARAVPGEAPVSLATMVERVARA